MEVPIDASSEPPTLLQALFGPAAGELLTISPRIQLWSDLFTLWLAALDAERGRIAYQQAIQSWTLLLAFHRCPPWQLDQPKLEAWLAHLVESDLTPNTVRCYRGRISAFFRYASRQPAMHADPFFAPGKFVNPFRLAVTPAPKNYEHAYVLRPAEARALLRAIDRPTSPLGRRDYALLLTLLLTGLPENDVRCLRWGDPSLTSLPAPALDAIHAFLDASGRRPVIQPGDYIFAPLADPLLRPASGDPADWLASHPLSTEQMLVSLKNYAAWARLDADRITFLALRHTAALLRLECGDDPAALQRFLDRSSLKSSRRYLVLLGRMLRARGRPPRPWVVRRGRPPRGPYRRKDPHGQPGNLNAMKHGFYLRRWLPGDLDNVDPKQLLIASLEDEIKVIRLLMRRFTDLTFEPGSQAEAVKNLETFSLATLRLAQLLQKHQALSAGATDAMYRNAISQAAEEVLQEFEERQRQEEQAKNP